MEVQALVVGIAGFVGYYLRGDPKIEVSAPVSPCHCHCSCDLSSQKEHNFILPLISTVVFLLCCIIGILFWVHREKQLTSGSPKGGKGVQGISGRYLPLTQ